MPTSNHPPASACIDIAEVDRIVRRNRRQSRMCYPDFTSFAKKISLSAAGCLAASLRYHSHFGCHFDRHRLILSAISPTTQRQTPGQGMHRHCLLYQRGVGGVSGLQAFSRHRCQRRYRRTAIVHHRRSSLSRLLYASASRANR